jgi:hypothetical protein
VAIPKDQADDPFVDDKVGDGDASQVLAVGGHAHNLVISNHQHGAIVDGASFHVYSFLFVGW